MKGGVSNSQQLRKQVQCLTQAREALQNKNQISGSMVKINNSLNNIKPLLARQTQYIKNFLQTTTTNDSSSKQAQTRRYLSRITDISLNDMNELLSIGEDYFTIQMKTNWNKIRNQYEKELMYEREKSQKTNVIQFVFKIMNFKDKVVKEFMKSLIYRKCLLWKDLNIAATGYVHSQKKKMTKLIDQYILNKKYAPTKPFFTLPQFNIPGQWNLNRMELQDAPLSDILKLLTQEVEEAYNTVRNYSNLNEEQRNHEDINRNKDIILSLRGEIQLAHQNYQILEKKYRETINKDEKLDIIQLRQKLKLAQEALENNQQQLKRLKMQYRDYTANMNTQKQKIKELENDLNRLTNIEMKKLKQVQLIQYSLSQQVSQISKKMSSLGTMFQFQSEGKKSLATTIINQKQIIQKMAGILGRHKNQNQRLQQEIKRLNLVIIELGLQIKTLKLSNATYDDR